MKGKLTLLGSILAVLLLVLAAGLTRAQDPEPPGEGVAPQGGVGVQAAVGAAIPIQGHLTDAGGNPLNGNYIITASIYNVSTGGTPLCSDTETISVTNGLFNMNIDTCTSATLNGQQLWLGIKVGADAEMTPRQPIYPVPYAWSLRPGADIADNSSSYLLRVNNGGTGQAIWALTAGSPAVVGHATAASGITYGVFGRSDSTTGWSAGVYGHATATSGYTYGVFGRSDSSTNWSSGVFGWATATSGDTWGVQGVSNSTDGKGVLGNATATSGVTYGVYGASASTTGRGVYGHATATSGVTYGVYGRTDSPDGWAGFFFTPNGNGVYISAPTAKIGLNVSSGTKNAVVRTADGSRLLYTEESTEVWFTDYGSGKLQNGVAVISIDPIFAQTVNLNEPYHVFVQAYGNASLYVANRTLTGFEVRLHDGDPNVEFSYRLVAKRLGHEARRLERAPWADNDPNLYPEKRATWEAQGGEP